MEKIICIAGPTASGKTELAVALAKELGGEVVSCDSMQIYRRMDIGTAKPSRQEMEGIPHHMLDVADPEENFSVSRYCAMADPIVRDILSRGKWAIVAGGTGLYMDALIRGKDFAPFPRTGRREALEAQADTEGIESVWQQLRQADPQAAQRLPLSDRKRIIRAMEVYLETGETITEHDRKTKLIPPRYEPCWIGLNFDSREELYRRVDLRVHKMMEAGLLQEVRSLLDAGIPAEATSMQAIGYKELVSACRGDESLDEAVQQIQQSSRRYAKRQLTWFRRNPGMHWILRRKDQPFGEILEEARRIVKESDK